VNTKGWSNIVNFFEPLGFKPKQNCLSRVKINSSLVFVSRKTFVSSPFVTEVLLGFRTSLAKSKMYWSFDGLLGQLLAAKDSNISSSKTSAYFSSSISSLTKGEAAVLTFEVEMVEYGSIIQHPK
jgi:hypothetical protein